MAGMDITNDVRVGQGMKEGQLSEFKLDQTLECDSPIGVGRNPEKNPPSEANMHLNDERDGLQLHRDEQQSRLLLLDRDLELSRQRLISILNDWSQYSRGELTGLAGLE
ncbi:hypothetical protein N7509_008297 [Penicillium cosmopolitanum]|uniref:Uncharacterized protein n=1 Tax=Penicillium cosmopolitanum TaxID=1131564 RepID=A0A9W9VMA9_9EURO|nr:uncharacterized protein N7509_008297 [Penicillium cosmopolitanum]KAJ5385756.1 hypothetical protein N7509_008297 [Penicillium cosmopolitanum]